VKSANIATCHREDELLDALGRGYVGAELQAHIDACTPCHELHLIAGGLLDVRTDVVTHAPIPTSGTMLWRMHMRKRRDAQAATRRTLLVGQALSLIVAIGLALAFFGSEIAYGVREGIALLQELPVDNVNVPLVLAIAMSVLLAPIAGWMMVRSHRR
jgi:hypothetical protein